MADSAEFLYTIQATRLGMLTEGPSPEEAAVIERHADYLRKLAKEGVVLVYGRTQNLDETTFGVVIFKAESEAAARKVMQDDPAVRHGIMSAELYPYKLVFMGKGGS